MKKRALSLFLAFVMVLGMLPGTALADAPREITSQSDLAAMDSGSYRLTEDIELNGWTGGLYFAGTLDGNGHTITLSGTPLFEGMGSDSSVSNLILKGTVTETGNKNVGALTRYCSGTIRNCISDVAVTYSGSSPFVYAAGLSGKVTGTISNCLVLGSLTNSAAECYGAVSNIALFESGTIQNCVAVGYDRIGSEEGFGSPTVISGTNCTLITAAEAFDPADYVAALNGSRSDGDLEWIVEDGALTLSASASDGPGETAGEEELGALRSAVSDAEAALQSGTLYTADSLSTLQSALSAAEDVLAEAAPSKAAVVNVAAALTAARGGLTKRETAAAALPDEGVIEVDQEYFNTYMEFPAAGACYRLTEDITITSSYWLGTYSTMNAVLDGDGHTITLNSSPLWSAIGPNGVVQNLGIASSGTVMSEGFALGTIAADCQGLIVNCWSRADVQSAGGKNAGGFVANLKSGGAIVNCWNAGTVASSGAAGAIAGTAGSNTMVKHCYWLNGDSAVGSGTCIASGNAQKSRADFYSDAFIDLLNSSRGENGKAWTLSGEGYPWFGEAQSYTPAEAAEITFTACDGTVTTFSSTDGLTIDLAARDSEHYAGTLSAEGVTGWENLSYDPTGQNNAVLLYDLDEDGNAEVYLYKAGSATIRAGGAEFTITVTEPRAAAALRLKAGDTVLADGDSLTVQGSEDVVFTAEAQYAGSEEWVSVPAGVLTFTGGPNAYVNGAVFHAAAPGSTTVTATGLGQSVTVNITSEYVPVASITPGPGTGTYVIHGRNANSDGLGDFLDLNLSHGAGSVVVFPANASYRDQWTLTSSDGDVAEYVDAFLKAVLPRKAGTATLTATATGEGETAVGNSTITLQYLNPVTSVTFDGGADFSVAENASLDLPLTFTGLQSAAGYHVTEPGMVWTQASDDGGAVEITRNGNPGMLVSSELEYCVANDRYLITGVRQGTVTVTGTPVDTTGGAAPVTFTVTVTEGTAETAADAAKLTADGIRGAQKYLTTNAQDTYAFGFEWEIFSLVRSGASVPQSKLDAYLDSVADVYSDPDADALKPTTLARVILTLGVLGEDASDFRGLDLVGQLYGSSRITDSSNEAMWALIALDSRNYAVPEDAAWTREALIGEILRHQDISSASTGGGFGLNEDDQVSVDMTAMALQALAPYCSASQTVKDAADLALNWLRRQLDRNCVAGGTSESTAQVLTALAALGIDPTDAGEGGFAASAARNLITALTGFQAENGGFLHTGTAQSVTAMSTMQALYSLEAYRRFAAGENRLFDLTDVSRSARSVLENRLNEANSLLEGDYTGESWAAMAAARDAAQAVFDRADATEEELRNAGSALAEAISGLVSVSAGPGGADGSIQVYVTISNAGEPVMAQRAVTVTDHNGNGSFDVDDALYAAHKAAYPGGASNGYASAEGDYGLSITKLWGDTSGSFGYWLNDAACWSLADEVQEHDFLTAFVYQDGTFYSDSYAKFDSRTYAAVTGEAITLSMENAGYDANWNTVFLPLANAHITAFDSTLTPLRDSRYTVTAAGDGTYAVQFSQAGTYFLIAQCDDPLIVPTVCQVTVSAPQGGGTDRITVFISVQDPQGETYLRKTAYTMAPDSTVYDLLRRTGLEITAADHSYGVYIQAIEGLGEFDQGSGSGWMYCVNGVFPEISCDSYVLTEQDAVEWLYTRSLGGDIGGGTSSDKVSGEDRAAAQEVQELIDTIGTVTADSGEKISAARKAYDGLTDAQKKLVENYGKLTDAEIAYAKLTGTVPFTDVDGHWALEAIRYVYEQGLMHGTGTTTFSPDLTTTRGMIVTILYRLEGAPAVSGGTAFADVHPDMYCADAVAWAASNGIVSGYAAGSFGPNDPITRQQLAVILYRYSAYKNYDTTARADMSRFADADQIGSWSFSALAWANAEKMINGMENNTLAPRGNATRAQAAMILMRYLEGIADQQ